MKLFAWLAVVCGMVTLSRAGFVECDLDLEDPKILAQLPAECQGLDEPTKALMLQEAAGFKLFLEKLLNYEAAHAPNAGEEVPMDVDFRRQLYTAADLHACLNLDGSLEEYVQCLMEKRRKMVEYIDSQTV